MEDTSQVVIQHDQAGIQVASGEDVPLSTVPGSKRKSRGSSHVNSASNSKASPTIPSSCAPADHLPARTPCSPPSRRHESTAGGQISQPRPSLDDEHMEERPAWLLAQALACSLCGDLLKEAMTAPECCHTYCYDCIESHVLIGGGRNVCPVDGCGITLGPNPFEHGKLKYDFMLDGLVRKIFPRPKLDKELDARRNDREQATREAKAALNRVSSKRLGYCRLPDELEDAGGRAMSPAKRQRSRSLTWQPPTPSGSASLPTDTANHVPHPDLLGIALFPRKGSLQPVAGESPAAGGRPEALLPLEQPYLALPPDQTIASLLQWLSERMHHQLNAQPTEITAAMRPHCSAQHAQHEQHGASPAHDQDKQGAVHVRDASEPLGNGAVEPVCGAGAVSASQNGVSALPQGHVSDSSSFKTGHRLKLYCGSCALDEALSIRQVVDEWCQQETKDQLCTLHYDWEEHHDQ